jgi:CDP-diacylglycerol--glycerol-3-phosphate 3-phosphatidyltransferase
MSQGGWWRQIPNGISAARLAATPVLLGAAVGQREALFQWLLLSCLLSDILDGLIARAFQLSSRLGAFLDSTADMLVTLIAFYGVYVFRWDAIKPHRFALCWIAGLYVLEAGAALYRYGRISSFHTLLVRISAYLQGIFVMSLFFWGFIGWMFGIMLAVTIAAYAEELVLVALLAEWKTDVRGLYWVLRG